MTLHANPLYFSYTYRKCACVKRVEHLSEKGHPLENAGGGGGSHPPMAMRLLSKWSTDRVNILNSKQSNL